MKYKAYRDGVMIVDNLDTPRYNHTGLEPETEYTFQFSSYTDEKESALSEALVVTTEADIEGLSLTLEVTVTPASGQLVVGEILQLEAESEQKVGYVSADPAIAKVTAVGGKVTALTAGETTITCTTEDGNHQFDVAITVTDPSETE